MHSLSDPNRIRIGEKVLITSATEPPLTGTVSAIMEPAGVLQRVYRVRLADGTKISVSASMIARPENE